MEVDDYYSTEESGNWSSRLNSTEICRVCANSNGYLIPIYEGEGLDNELAMKIQKHLPIQICEEDTFPKQVCYQCASTLIAWHELVITCVEADRKIRNLENEEDDEDYQVDDKIIEETPAETCIVQIKTAKSLQPSISDKPVSEEQSESEKGKNSPAKRRDALKDCTTVKIVEVKTPTPGPSVQQASSKSPNVQEIMVDKERTSEDVTTSERWHRLPRASFKNFRQVYCAVSSPNIVVSHSLGKHEQEQNKINERNAQENVGNDLKLEVHENICDDLKLEVQENICGREMKLDNNNIWSDLEDNRPNTMLDDRPMYKCDYCGKKLTTRENMKAHWRIHTGECPYTCHVCGKRFRAPSGIKRHIREVHERVKDHNCEFCGRGFANKRTLEDHKRIHTGERPYVCDSCEKSFKTKASLYIHKKGHTDIFPFQCASCGKGFRVQSKLTLHVLQHTGEKPHICDICGKAFRVKYELGKHKLIHSSIMPFVCVECGHRFRQERYLRNHKKNTHGRTN